MHSRIPWFTRNRVGNERRVTDETSDCAGSYYTIIPLESDCRSGVGVSFVAMFQRSMTECSSALWSSEFAEHFARECAIHPFVVKILSGTLPRASFQQYIQSDFYFLQNFAKAYAFALTKSEDMDGVAAFHDLIGEVLHEIDLHRKFAASWNVQLDAAVGCTPAAEKYANFLIDIGLSVSSSCADMLAAICPCMRLYAKLGQTLKQAQDTMLSKETLAGTPYQDWLKTYASAEFELAARKVECLLDKYAKTDEKSTSRYSSLYNSALQLELDFFQEAAGDSDGKGQLHECSKDQEARDAIISVLASNSS
jgi:thiaminase/transcriptional activator TenA